MIHQNETLKGDIKKGVVKRRHENETLQGDTKMRQ